MLSLDLERIFHRFKIMMSLEDALEVVPLSGKKKHESGKSVHDFSFPNGSAKFIVREIFV